MYQDEFNTAAANATFFKQNDACISTRTGEYGPYIYHTYNFMTRTLVVHAGGNDAGIRVYLFDEVDRDVLQAMRTKLVSLGGKPPALAEADSNGQRGVIRKAP